MSRRCTRRLRPRAAARRGLTDARRGAGAGERQADARAAELLDALHMAPAPLRSTRDLLLIIEGGAVIAVPHDMIGLAVSLLAGREIAREVADLDCAPGRVRVLVLLRGGWAHVTSLGLRLMQPGGAA